MFTQAPTYTSNVFGGAFFCFKIMLGNFLPLWSTNLSSTLTDVATTLSLSNYTNLVSGEYYYFTIDRVDATGKKTLSAREVVLGRYNGTSIVNCLRGRDGTTAQTHSSGAIVEMLVVAEYLNTLTNSFQKLSNYNITATITSNNLVVAIKNILGNNPDASDAVTLKIGSNIRSITTAKTFTLNAGTNFFNAGSAELATKAINYFVYAIDHSGTVEIGISRIPSGKTIADFSATSTNEKYIATSGSTSSGDSVEVIGRITATLSAGTAYTWSNATGVISRPIHTTDVLTSYGTIAPTAPMTMTSQESGAIKYMINNDSIEILEIYALADFDGTASTSFTVSLPFSANSNTSIMLPVVIGEFTYSPSSFGLITFSGATNLLYVYKEGRTNWSFSTSTGIWGANFRYKI